MYRCDCLCQCKHLVYAHLNLWGLQHTLQFLVYFQSHETDTYMGLDSFACKMEHRTYLYLWFYYTESVLVLSLKVCKLFFSFILVISIFLYFLPTFELVYFSFIPTIVDFTNEDSSDNQGGIIEANYRRVKQEILSLVDSEIERIKNTPALSYLIPNK